MKYRTNKYYPRKGWWYPRGFSQWQSTGGYFQKIHFNWKMFRENHLRYLWDRH